MNKTIALFPIARTTFDLDLANEMFARMQASLKQAGYALLGPETLISDQAMLENAVETTDFSQADVLLVFQATFADAGMAKFLAEKVDVPMVLWAVHEEPNGDRLRLNSFCGINLAGHALTRSGKKYGYIYAVPEDTDAMKKLGIYAAAGKVRRVLRQSVIGRIGEHPDGFDSCKLNETGLKDTFGVRVYQVALNEFFEQVRQVKAEAVQPVHEKLASRVDGLDVLDQDALQGTLRSYVVLDQLHQDEKLAGYAVRCWPEFFTEMGCAACGAMSMMSDQMVPTSCEVDINGTITQLMLQTLSGEPAFGSDLVHIDFEKQEAVLWHCGLAPLSMANPKDQPRGIVHTNRKLPLLMEFTLKPGVVTLARLSEASGEFRLVIGRGTVIEKPKSFSGTSGVLRFERDHQAVFETILREGLEHHISLTYGDYVEELILLAEMLKLPVLHL